jgi:predicted nucleic acid-binding protein
MVDTNIVIDLREEDPRWFDWSSRVIATAGRGRPLASVIVVGELASRGGPEHEVMAILTVLGIDTVQLSVSAAHRAGVAQHQYRQAGGGRDKLLADFLIGAHAASLGEPLLTRDPRRYRSYFPDLTLITPETHPNG